MSSLFLLFSDTVLILVYLIVIIRADMTPKVWKKKRNICGHGTLHFLKIFHLVLYKGSLKENGLDKKKRRSGARLSRVENSMTVADWRIFYSVKFVVVNVVVVLNSLHLLQLSFLFVNTQKPKKNKYKKKIKKQKENKWWYKFLSGWRRTITSIEKVGSTYSLFPILNVFLW